MAKLELQFALPPPRDRAAREEHSWIVKRRQLQVCVSCDGDLEIRVQGAENVVLGCVYLWGVISRRIGRVESPAKLQYRAAEGAGNDPG